MAAIWPESPGCALLTRATPLPDDVLFVADLAHTTTGKLHKAALRERFRDYRFADA